MHNPVLNCACAFRHGICACACCTALVEASAIVVVTMAYAQTPAASLSVDHVGASPAATQHCQVPESVSCTYSSCAAAPRLAATPLADIVAIAHLCAKVTSQTSATYHSGFCWAALAYGHSTFKLLVENGLAG